MKVNHIIDSYMCEHDCDDRWSKIEVNLDTNSIMFHGLQPESWKHTTYAKFKILSKDKVEVIVTKESIISPGGLKTGHKFMYHSPKFLKLINEWTEYIESLLLGES